MLDFQYTPLPRLDAYTDDGGFVPRANLDPACHEDPTICAEAKINQHMGFVNEGTIPGFTISRRSIDLMLGASLATVLDALSADRFISIKSG